ncbi:PPOX class F420-dependent oxidoreductase [Amycolatopsis pithecellobii]|uniref:TIGR03618 family F420-dependent PPOX class oxidoreductase n=1 Tax=Amycolatopsis pithecellobii TaxID=664692 RepID=A0A6N7Z9Q9_9PSEU|nr:PPOX class F420-dependent oxidoreductase [Amycolatopsis pithecellobii]MTD58459.1 TIGR03618 family F420-dependent PPOX class oxidoreductase [Amycolatopsis pithecellobii]
MSPEFQEFWSERHLCTLTTLRPDGSPHVVVVGVTLDEKAEVARVICGRGSVKARNVRADGRVAVSQHDGRRWSTLEGQAVIREDAESVRDGENRYAERYGRQPRPNPERVVIEITITRTLGMS